MAVSVIICCYNSARRLPETLRHLALQQVSAGLEWEVVVVNNASADDTVAVALSYSGKLAIRVVDETRPGLSFARQTGVNAASNDIVIFCDDDNWLAPQYVATAHEIMSANVEIGICGGVGHGVFESSSPEWFSRHQLVFACGEQSTYEGELGLDVMALYGAGMVVRKGIFNALSAHGYQHILTGRKGDKVIAGEDYELCILARALGYKLYYDRRLSFGHYMPHQRMQWSYLFRIVYGSALSSAPIYIYADALRGSLTGNPRYKVSWLKDLLKAVYGSFLLPVKNPRDLRIIWARLTGSIKSVIANIPNYRHYEQKIKRLYEEVHKGV
ncbi:MAG: glycosyltransferase family 2 protein [Flavipsychrobacter sp.]|nr:glycosyltransferase family 2 protein [Flavipsychrobacter sp.]